MSRSTARLITIFAAWTLFVWVTRIRNILGDDETSAGFKAVHSILALVSVVAIVILTQLGTNVGLVFTSASDALGGV